jgi:hypothetical protein
MQLMMSGSRNVKRLAITMLLANVLCSAPDARAVLVCDTDGRPVQELTIKQDRGSFDLVRRYRGQAGHAANSRIEGAFNDAAGVQAGPGGWPAVASFQAPDGSLGIVVWFRNGTFELINGVLTGVSFSSSPRAAVLLGYRPNPTGDLRVEQQRVFSQTGAKVAERSIPWESESFSRGVLSEDGSVVYRRFGSGMSSEQEVQLFDSATFSEIGRLSLGGEYISDIVVIDRHTAFMTGGGGFFRVHDGSIESIGQPDLPVRHERLDVDVRNGRVLSFGSGGYQVVSLGGAPIRSQAHGKAYAGADGFATDGSIIEGAVQGRRGLRVVDAVSGDVLTELPPASQASPRSRKIACSSKFGLVFEDEGLAGRSGPKGQHSDR